MAEVTIRSAAHDDWPAIWEIIREVTVTGETFALDSEIAESDHRKQWMTDPPGRVVVAEDADGFVVGTSNMYANRPAQGSHVASGSLMVARDARGIGVGRSLVRDMIRWATHEGYAALQFNAVVETNTAAITLYLSEGFSIVGTVPDAFTHPRLGPVAVHIMWRALGAERGLVTDRARSERP